MSGQHANQCTHLRPLHLPPHPVCKNRSPAKVCFRRSSSLLIACSHAGERRSHTKHIKPSLKILLINPSAPHHAQLKKCARERKRGWCLQAHSRCCGRKSSLFASNFPTVISPSLPLPATFLSSFPFMPLSLLASPPSHLKQPEMVKENHL